jgi:DNA-binding Lrp family transcriptional regulator
VFLRVFVVFLSWVAGDSGGALVDRAGGRASQAPHGGVQSIVVMDAGDRLILEAVQADLPLVPRPFDALGARLGMAGDAVLARVRRMAAAGTIRRLGPRFDSRRLGYASTLIALRVPDERLEAVAEAVNRYPEVTHNYQREGPFNLWFTLIAASRRRCGAVLAELVDALRLDEADVMELPAERVWKLDVRFAPWGAKKRKRAAGGPAKQATPPPGAATTAAERRLVAALRGGLPISATPYADVGRRLGTSADAVLDTLRAMVDDGRVRSMGAVLSARHLGYGGNVLAAWDVTDDALDAVGRRFAALEAVSHCYQRPRRAGWPYNLYTMVHAADRPAAEALLARMAGAEGVRGQRALFTIREFKKAAPAYG